MSRFRGLLLGALGLASAFTASPAQARVAGHITVYPANNTCEIGYLKIYGVAGKQFTAYVPISPNGIDWLVNGIVGGNATIGTISPTGLYVPPAQVPKPNVVTISARSKAYRSQVGSTSLTITRDVPRLWSVYPSPIPSGKYEVTLNGSNFAPDSIVTANDADVATTFVSPTSLIARGSAVPGTLTFKVRQPGPGAVSSNKVSVKVVAPPVTVAISPPSATLQLGASQAFSATVTGNANTMVSWSVNGMAGGSPATGMISMEGVYTAPSSMPSSSSVTIRATSMAAPESYAQATITLASAPPPPVTVTVSPSVASVAYQGTRTFAATVKNASSSAVTWSVNGIAGGSSSVGTISSSGLYTAPSSSAASASVVTVTATSVASPSVSGQATVTLTDSTTTTNPAWLSGGRFLEQSTFGPTPASMAEVKQLGFSGWLQKQFSLPETPVFVPASNSMGELQQWILYNYTTAPDQLRQRMAYSLGQIVVTSSNKLIYADEIIPWLRLLNKHAFGNYRAFLRDVSVSPSMGKYLDLANSLKPGLAGGANENYARELLQLFTIGLWQLNMDGSLKLDGAGQPIPTYNQATIQQVALALTGWTYATAPGKTPGSTNWEYFGAPMETRSGNHDTGPKNVLGVSIPAGQSVEQDLDSVLDIVFNHPNTPPFIATRLIRSLVKSNPTPGYIARVAAVFADNGSGVRGDLKAVLSAILLDPEARNDTPVADGGRLKEPILQVSEFLRLLNGAFLPTQQITYLYESFAQMPLGPPSVFNWFSPLYRIPRSSLFGPEFQIYSPSEAALRGNFLYWLLNEGSGTVTLDLSPFQAYGNDMPGLVEAVNQALLFGRMDPAMKQIIATAAAPGYDAATRIQTVIYLTALSGQFAVQH